MSPHLSVAAQHVEDLPEPRLGCADLGLWSRTEPPYTALLVHLVPLGVQHESLMCYV